MSQNDLIARLSVKSHEHIFLHELENDFELSPKEARGILESVKTIFNLEGASHPGNIRPGQIREIVLAQDASPGKPLSQLKKVEVTFTLDAGEEELMNKSLNSEFRHTSHQEYSSLLHLL